MLKNLLVVTTMLTLVGSMPGFASAAVNENLVPNEVTPTTRISNGMDCPQLGFGNKIVEKILASQELHDHFTASINSIIWDVKSDNLEVFHGIHGRGRGPGPGDIENAVSLKRFQDKGSCSYHISMDDKSRDFDMTIKPSVDQERKARHIAEVTRIVQRIKEGGVVTRADLLAIINKIMP